MNNLDPISIVIGIALSILANLLTVPVQNRLWSRFKTQKKLSALEKELAQVTDYYNDRGKLYLRTILVAFGVLAFFGFGDAMWALVTSLGFTVDAFHVVQSQVQFEAYRWVYLIVILMSTLFYLIGIYWAIAHIRLVAKVAGFEKYRRTIEAKIGKLKTLPQSGDSPAAT